jgi:hypothetical protein
MSPSIPNRLSSNTVSGLEVDHRHIEWSLPRPSCVDLCSSSPTTRAMLVINGAEDVHVPEFDSRAFEGRRATQVYLLPGTGHWAASRLPDRPLGPNVTFSADSEEESSGRGMATTGRRPSRGAGARRDGAHLKISFQVSVMSFGCPPPGWIRSVHGPSRPLRRCPDDTHMVIMSLSGTGRWHSGESTPSRS